MSIYSLIKKLLNLIKSWKKKLVGLIDDKSFNLDRKLEKKPII